MTNERRATAMPILYYVLLAIFISGCSTMQPVDLVSGEPLIGFVEQGDEVKVTMHNDDIVEFVVVEIVDDVIVGIEQTISLDDIRELEVKTMNVPATVGLVVGLTTIGIQLLGVSAGFVPLGY